MIIGITLLNIFKKHNLWLLINFHDKDLTFLFRFSGAVGCACHSYGSAVDIPCYCKKDALQHVESCFLGHQVLVKERMHLELHRYSRSLPFQLEIWFGMK